MAPQEMRLSDKRIKGKRPVAFKFCGKEFPTEPKHAFFDWLYIISLIQRKDDVYAKMSQFDGFSDIFYSPRKDPNCQGRAASKFVALKRNGLLTNDTSSADILKLLCGFGV